MLASALVSLEPLQGVAYLGNVTVAIAPTGTRGELRVGGETGPVLRSLTLGERNRLVWQATAAATPHQSLLAGLRSLANVTPGQGTAPREPDDCLDVIALALAGGIWEQAPPLDQTVMWVARETGWSPQQLAEAIATEVDQLALSLVEAVSADPRSEAGWKRLVLLSPEESDLAYIREQLTNNLLRRGQGSTTTENWQDEPSLLPGSNFEAATENRAVAAPPAFQSHQSDQADRSNRVKTSLRQVSFQPHPAKLEATASLPGVQIPSPTEAVAAQANPRPFDQAPQRPNQPAQALATPQRFSIRSWASFSTTLPSSRPMEPTLEKSLEPVAKQRSTSAGVSAQPGRSLPATSEPLPSSAPLSSRATTVPAAGVSLSDFSGAACRTFSGDATRSDSFTSPSTISSTSAAPMRSPPLAKDLPKDLADTLAALLHHEADLRGIPR